MLENMMNFMDAYNSLEAYKYNSELDINMKIRIRGDIKKDLTKDIVVKRSNNGKMEKVSISFLVPSITENNQTIVIKGEGNRRNNERGNLNIKAIKNKYRN